MKQMKFLIFIVFFTWFSAFWGQTIVIGTGTSESQNTECSPVTMVMNSTVQYFVYTKSELDEAGASSTDPISAIGFYPTEGTTNPLPNYEISVKHTNLNDCSSSLGTGGWTVIKSGFSYNPVAGNFDMITADGSFTWDGNSNVAVKVCWNAAASRQNRGKVRIIHYANGMGYRWTRNNASQCAKDFNTVQNFKPQVRIVFKPGTTTSWTGAVNKSWNNPANWSVCVPTKTMDVIIPSGATNLAEINGYNINCRNLLIQGGASLTVVNGEELNIYGNFVNWGLFNAGNSVVHFKGTLTHNIQGSGVTFYELKASGTGAVNFSSGSANIKNFLRPNGPQINLNGLVNLVSNVGYEGRIPEIKGSCSYELRMADRRSDSWQGGHIIVNINGAEYGRFSCVGASTIVSIPILNSGLMELVYVGGSNENENSYELRDPLGNVIFSDGPRPTVGLVYSTTASCSFVNPLIGNYSVERYIDAGATHWRFLSFPVVSATLNEFNDDFLTAGIPGSDYPNWPSAANPWRSIWFYDETVGIIYDDGLIAPTSMTNPLVAGKGAWVWSGDNSSGTAPFTIDVQGAPVTGPFNFNISFTNAAGSLAHDGWNLVGNPYPCTIDWNALGWTKSNVANSLYIWNPDLQQYASYVGGLGVNGGSNFIAPFQAFYVQALNSSASLVVNEACKVETSHGFLKASTENLNHLRLELEHNNLKNETVIRFNDNGTNDFDLGLDAKAMSDGITSTAFICTKINDVRYAINTLPTSQHYTSLPLLITAPSAGICKIKITDWSGLSGNCLLLEDKITNTFVDFLVDSVYTFTQPVAVNQDRFVIHFMNGVDRVVKNITCSNQNDGWIYVNTHASDSSSYIWKNLNGDILQTSWNDFDGDTLKELSAGSYIIEAATTSACGSDVDTIQVINPPIMTVSMLTSEASCLTCLDGSVSALIAGGVPPFTYEWADHPEVHGFLLEDVAPGFYDVVITDGNGCVAAGEIELGIHVVGLENDNEKLSDFVLYPNPGGDNFTVKLNYRGTEPLDFQLINVLGERVHERTIAPGVGLVDIEIKNLPEGLYLFFLSDHASILSEGRYLKID